MYCVLFTFHISIFTHISREGSAIYLTLCLWETTAQAMTDLQEPIRS
jgi:hypothetical protein